LQDGRSSKLRNLLVFAYVSFFSMWFIVCSAFIVYLASSDAIFFDTTGGKKMRADFVCFYETGKIAMSEDRTKPYDPDVQLKWLNRLTPYPNDTPPFIQYAPFIFLMMAPLTMLRMSVALLCWDAFSLFCSIVGMILLCTTNKTLSKPAIATIVIVVLATGPAFATLRVGQSSLFILGVLCLFYWGVLTRNLAATAIGAGLTPLKIQYVPAAGLPLLGTANWRAILLAIVVTLVLLFLAGLNMGFETVINYPIYLLRLEQLGGSHGVKGPVMVSLRGVLEYTLGDKLGFRVMLAMFASGAAGIFFLWKKFGSLSGAHQRWLIAFTTLWQMLFSLHSHYPDCVLLAVAPIMVPPLINSNKGSSWQTNKAAMSWWSILWLSFPFAGWFQLFIEFMIPDPPVYCYWVSTLWLLMLMVSAWTIRPHRNQEVSAAGDAI
jgi:hypothetical protein